MGDTMDQDLRRFTHCDPRFHPYIERVLARLPEEVAERLLNDRGFQILAGDELLEECVLRYEFEAPVRKLVYFNTKMLMEPEHWLTYAIAHEVARYMIGQGEAEAVEKQVEELLVAWGFTEEMETFRYDTVIAESEGYEIGYEWARRQSKDYVLRHFGLYFDEWNEKGLRRMSRERFELLQSKAATAVPDEVSMGERETIEGAPPRNEAIIAGIMAAVKEIKFRDLYGDKACDLRSR
jgi:hypothetical protein